MSQHLDDLVSTPSAHELNAAQQRLGGLNQQYVGIAKEAGWLAASSVPVVGGFVDVASAIGNAWSGNWGDAGLDVVGLIPFVGDGIKGGAKGTKLAVKGAALAKKISRAKSQVRGMASRIKKIKPDIAKWKKAKGKDYEKLQDELKKCKTKACRKKKVDEYKNKKKGRKSPLPKHGKWDGEPGNSKWRPDENSGADVKQAMKDYKQVGVNWKNGQPDFSPFTKKGLDGRPMEVNISDMKGGSLDYTPARQAMRERYPGWNSKLEEDGFNWHHKRDEPIMQLVDQRVHLSREGGLAHAGGSSHVRDAAF